MSKQKLKDREFDLSINSQREAYWTLLAEDYLLGKQIMKVEYITEGHGMRSKEAQEQLLKNNPNWSPYYKYTYKQPVAAPQFQELPSTDIQQQISRQAEMEYERDRRPLLRSGAGRSTFGTGRT